MQRPEAPFLWDDMSRLRILSGFRQKTGTKANLSKDAWMLARIGPVWSGFSLGNTWECLVGLVTPYSLLREACSS